MKKKYQVFISSTYRDLKEERIAVTLYLLDNDCIPVGMEQFPASNMSQMDYIKKMLQDCDYYILILGGKYGTPDSDGIGFTEKEFDYAKSIGIPVMSFVVKDMKSLQGRQLEETDEMRGKLNAFREKVCSDKLVNFYTDIGDLKAKIGTSLHRCFEDFPRPGWVRGDSVPAPEEGLDADAIKKIAKQALKESMATDEEVDEMLNSVFGKKVQDRTGIYWEDMPDDAPDGSLLIKGIDKPDI